MSAGSSNIDPSEFNELVDVVPEEAANVPDTAQDQDTGNFFHRSVTHGQVRRFRQRVHAPPAGVSYRICIYQPQFELRPTRHALNRIIFSIARALRTRRSVRGRPGLRPGVIYGRSGDVITLDVQGE